MKIKYLFSKIEEEIGSKTKIQKGKRYFLVREAYCQKCSWGPYIYIYKNVLI